MTDSDEGCLVELFRLLEEKQKPDCPLATQQVFYVKACQFLQRNPKCVWCKLTPLSVELLHLYSLPPNPLLDIFSQITKDCLSTCSSCVHAYHVEREGIFKRLANEYEMDALKTFEAKLNDWDYTRLSSFLGAYIKGDIDSSNQKLLYSIFEVLGFPYLLSSPELDLNFCKTVHLLMSQKKMLKLSQLMPGIIVLAFHSDEKLRNWAQSVMRTNLSKPSKWPCKTLNLNQLVMKIQGNIGRTETLKSATHALLWYPTDNLIIDYRWLLDCLNQINLEDVDSMRLLCVLLRRLANDKRLLMLGDLSLLDFVQKLLTHPKLVGLISKHAIFPMVEEDVINLPWEACLTEWIRLASNAACKLKDGILLKLIVDNLTRILPSLGSSNATNNVLSMLINIVHYCTTSEDLGDERFYIISVKKTLEFLVSIFAEQNNTNKLSPILFETFKTCLQFDFNELEYLTATLHSEACTTQSDSLHKSIFKYLFRFTDDRPLFNAIFDLTLKLFIDSETNLFNLALHSRTLYLDFLATSWPLFILSSEKIDEKKTLLIILIETFSSGSISKDLLETLVSRNPSAFVVSIASWIKRLKPLESKPLGPVSRMLQFIMTTLVPVVFNRKLCLLDNIENSLYLKLQFITSVLKFLNYFQSVLAQEKKTWEGFFDCAKIMMTVVDSLGIDALKQCIRENPGMQQRFSQAPRWIVYFCKHCTFLDHVSSKNLSSFLIYCINVCVAMKASISGLEKCLDLYFGATQIDPTTANRFSAVLKSYESEFSVKLNVHLLIISERPKISNSEEVIEIENMLMQKLKEESRTKEVIPPLLYQTKPASKLGQIRQELVRDAQPLKLVPRKKINPSVYHTAKAVKLDVHGREEHFSSDAEEQNDIIEIKDNLSFMSNQAKEYSGRQVKVISLEDQVDATKSTKSRSQIEEEFFADSNCAVKKLHKYLLNLDFDSLDDRSLDGFSARPIPDCFENVEDYISCFEPLLLFECRSQLLQAKMELDSIQPFPVRVLSISNVDSYHEVTVGIDPSKGDEDDNNSSGGRVLSEHDYVIARVETGDPQSEIIGIVTQSTFKGNKTEAVIKFRFRPHQSKWQVHLRIGLTWKMKKLCNWITSIREYSALHNVAEFRLLKSMLSPSSLPIDKEVVETTSNMLEKSLEVNRSQANSIAIALNNPNPFTLIQGPPGTGKTRTILGLVGALFGRPYPSLSSKLRPQRLLICAPSNAAIDEIVRRLKVGTYDCYHQQFSPKILRLGSHEMIHEEVKDLTLDATVERTFNAACKESLELLKEQKASLAKLKKELDHAEEFASPEQHRLKQELWNLKDNLKKNSSFIDGTKQTLRNKVVAEAQVICTTLSSSGIDLLSKLQFDVVIIDEACQAVETSALIPLQYGCKHCILVGGTFCVLISSFC